MGFNHQGRAGTVDHADHRFAQKIARAKKMLGQSGRDASPAGTIRVVIKPAAAALLVRDSLWALSAL